MEAKNILESDWLDILFEHMNKDYGAYQLRKTYARRLTWAMVITASVSFAFIGGIVGARYLQKEASHQAMVVADVNLMNIKEKEATPPPVVPPPPPKLSPPKIEIKSFTVPRIVDKVDVKKEVKSQADLENTTIGKIDQAGIKAPDIVNPPKVEKESNVVSGPVTPSEDRIFTKVEIEAQFPGGNDMWNEYVRKTISSHLDELSDDGHTGTCEVQFIVNKEGVVSDVQALSMQGTKLAEISVDAIRRGPKWIPAQQNGLKVTSYKRQKIVFLMPTN